MVKTFSALEACTPSSTSDEVRKSPGVDPIVIAQVNCWKRVHRDIRLVKLTYNRIIAGYAGLLGGWKEADYKNLSAALLWLVDLKWIYIQ